MWRGSCKHEEELMGNQTPKTQQNIKIQNLSNTLSRFFQNFVHINHLCYPIELDIQNIIEKTMNSGFR